MTLQEYREKFDKDLFATKTTGIVIDDAKEGYSKCSIKLKDLHYNAAGGVMGGVIFTLADFAFAVASNYGEKTVVTLNSQVNFLSTAKGKLLTATAKSIKEGKNTCYYIIDITDELGTNVASVTATGMRV